MDKILGLFLMRNSQGGNERELTGRKNLKKLQKIRKESEKFGRNRKKPNQNEKSEKPEE